MRTNLLKPLVIFELYLVSTIVLFEFGPIKFPTNNKRTLYLFLFLYHLFFIIGYIIIPKKFKFRDNNIMNRINMNFCKYKNFIISSLLLLVIFYSTMSIIRISGGISFMNLVDKIFYSFSNFADVYKENMSNNYGSSIITSSSTLLSSVYYMGIPLAVYFHKDLRIYNKILLYIAIFFEGSSYIIKGTNIGMFNLAIIIATVILIKPDIKFKKMPVKKILIYGVVPFLFISYFINVTSSRMGGGINLPSTLFNIPIDHNNFIFKFLPQELWYGVVMIISYISQGYYGMSLAFDYSFNPTFGFGSGYFMIENFSGILDVDIFSNTYQSKMSYVWDSRINWHTAYTWFANDVSFIGVIFIMILLGAFLYFIINDAKKGNIFAISLLPLYTIMTIFLSANNVILSTPTFFMPFVFINTLWLITKDLIVVK